MNEQLALGRSARTDLDDLRQPGLSGMCAATLVISWLWLAVAGAGIRYDELYKWVALLPPVVLMLASAGAFLATAIPVRWRSTLFLFGLCATFILGYLVWPSPAWLYGQALIIAVAGLLAGLRASFLIAALLTVSSLASLRVSPLALLPIEIASSLAMVWAVAVVSSLSTQNLYTALGWAMNSQTEAWQTASEVRDRRAELRRTLDTLRATYGLLERTMRELDAARLEAEEARQVKSRFVANISHELRTPLNVIIGFAEMLCTMPETYGDFAWPLAVREDVLAIWRNAEHLLHMVDDVLDLAQMENARFTIVPEPTDVLQLIRETLAAAEPLVRAARLELRVVLPNVLPPLSLDRTRIRQVLLNLITNATRFTAEGFIEVGCQPSPDEVMIYVRDSGTGIPDDKMETIFHEFEQIDGSLRRHQGVGLGLAISRQIIRLHGGRIWTESRLGQGSTFFFTLPLTSGVSLPAATFGTPTAERRPSDNGKKSVVILSSDQLALRLMQRHLEDLRVVPAASLAEAETFVHEHHPSAVVVAESLPLALQKARTIVSMLAPIDIPVLACDMPTERHAGLALGVDELLIKPVVHRDVVAAIRRLCPTPRRVLVADDDPDMVRLLEREVQAEWRDAVVLTAQTGDETLALLPEHPDVLVLDLMMPGKSGVQVLREMHAQPDTARIAVVVVTGRGPAEDLVTTQTGELHVLKHGCFSASELVRVLGALAKSLPPNYVAAAGAPPGTRAVELV